MKKINPLSILFSFTYNKDMESIGVLSMQNANQIPCRHALFFHHSRMAMLNFLFRRE